MLLILELLCGCCLIHFVFATVMFNDSCIEHFSKYYVKFFNAELFTGKEFQKKGGICSFNARITTLQINSCLPHFCKNLSTIPPPHRLQFYFNNCVQEGQLKARVESCA